MLNLVKTVGFPRDADQRVQRILLSNAKILHFKRKQIIFCEGHPVMGIYCITAGMAKVYKMGYNGRPYILHFAGLGEILNLESAFGGGYFSSTGEMLDHGEVAFIEKNNFINLLRTSQCLPLFIADVLAQRIAFSNDERVHLAEESTRERMARALLKLGKDYGVAEGPATRINLKLSRDDLAGLIGTSCGTVMRLLKDFKEDGAIRLVGKNIFIVREDYLEGMAHLSEGR